jgi:hypothetical protein
VTHNKLVPTQRPTVFHIALIKIRCHAVEKIFPARAIIRIYQTCPLAIPRQHAAPLRRFVTYTLRSPNTSLRCQKNSTAWPSPPLKRRQHNGIQSPHLSLPPTTCYPNSKNIGCQHPLSPPFQIPLLAAAERPCHAVDLNMPSYRTNLCCQYKESAQLHGQQGVRVVRAQRLGAHDHHLLLKLGCCEHLPRFEQDDDQALHA